jgi:hypothetical protein
VHLSLRRGAAILVALVSLILGFTSTPAGAAPLQGANQFGNAPFVQSVGGVFRGTTVGTNKQAGEPDHANNDGGASVWFKWRAVNDGPVRITTRGSDFDTLLAVYRGPDLQNLAVVRQNDDTPEADFLWSRVQFPAQAGVTYRIAIDGYNGSGAGTPPPVERGNYVLRITNL